MIAHLRGTLIEKHPNQVIVEAAGVGYDVQIPISTYTSLPDVGAAVALRIYTHVREDMLSLFGFATAEEKLVFERLISVSGIGPKLANTVLSGLATSNLIGAIRNSDVQQLVRIPGVGKKTAERIVLELKDKLPGMEGAEKRWRWQLAREDRSARWSGMCFRRCKTWAARRDRLKKRFGKQKSAE